MGRKTMTCRKCGVEKMAGEFERREAKARVYRLRICRVCRPLGVTRHLGEGPWKVDNPCKQCGKEFWRAGIYSHVRRLKFCSDRCDRQARRNAFRKCYRCEKKLPFEAFDRQQHWKKARQINCKRCVALRSRDQEDGTMRAGPASMLKCARSWAKQLSVPFDLKMADTRKFYDGDCYLCGKAPYSLYLRDKAAGYVRDNLLAVCLKCKSSLTRDGLQEVLLRSMEIASRHFREQLVHPQHREKGPCEHCGLRPQAEQETIDMQEATRDASSVPPSQATRVVAALQEHVT